MPEPWGRTRAMRRDDAGKRLSVSVALAAPPLIAALLASGPASAQFTVARKKQINHRHQDGGSGNSRGISP